MANTRKHAILVVDDEKEVTISLQSFFETLGHEMYIALDGEEATYVIDQVRPELVVLDIRMPKVNGKEILKKIRSTYRDIKVIVITAYEQEREEVEKIGVDGFFIKPVDLPALIDRIRHVLETKGDTKVYPTKEVKEKEVGRKVPKARVLFIEPNINVYGYTCGLFNSKEFNPGEYETKVAYSFDEAVDLFHPSSLYEFSPDIVIIYDANAEFEELTKLPDYIMGISHKPRKVIVHGIFPRTDYEIAQLKKKGILYCDQNVCTDEDFRKINKKLIDFIADECINLGLIKK